jgi:hypothetical protein
MIMKFLNWTKKSAQETRSLSLSHHTIPSLPPLRDIITCNRHGFPKDILNIRCSFSTRFYYCNYYEDGGGGGH